MARLEGAALVFFCKKFYFPAVVTLDSLVADCDESAPVRGKLCHIVWKNKLRSGFLLDFTVGATAKSVLTLQDRLKNQHAQLTKKGKEYTKALKAKYELFSADSLFGEITGSDDDDDDDEDCENLLREELDHDQMNRVDAAPLSSDFTGTGDVPQVVDGYAVDVSAAVKDLLAESDELSSWKQAIGPAMRTIFTQSELESSCAVNDSKSPYGRPTLDKSRRKIIADFARVYAKSSKCKNNPKVAPTEAEINAQLGRICYQKRRLKRKNDAKRIKAIFADTGPIQWVEEKEV